MNEQQFIQWLKGYVEGVHHYNITPAQWDHLKEVLNSVNNTTVADYSIGDWTTDHT